jgi:Domain of unknown function (DUF1937)
MNPSICYLASPYSHADPAVRQARFEAACRAAAELIRQGLTIYSPIAHSHAICQCGVPLDWQFWQAHDLAFLAMCNEVMVLKLDGWAQSVGVQAEIAAAKALGKPVSFLDPAAVAEERSGAT